MGEYYYCYSLGQALVHAVGLSTGRPTQRTETALVIRTKLIAFDHKKKAEGYWAGLAENLPRDAMALCKLHRRALACNRLVTPGTTCEEDMCKHVVLTEVVAWYAQHPTRMTGYEQFTEAIGSLQRCLPALPWLLHSNTSQAEVEEAEKVSKSQEEEEEKEEEKRRKRRKRKKEKQETKESQSEEEEEEKEEEKRRKRRKRKKEKKEKQEKKEKKEERKMRKKEEEETKKKEEEEEEEEKRKKEEEEKKKKEEEEQKKKRKKEEKEKEEEEEEEGMVLLQKPPKAGKRPNKKAKQVR